MVLNLKEMMVFEEVPDAVENIFLDSWPVLFVEDASEAIWPRCLSGAKTRESLNNFYF
jgi:hypothetical protein